MHFCAIRAGTLPLTAAVIDHAVNITPMAKKSDSRAIGFCANKAAPSQSGYSVASPRKSVFIRPADRASTWSSIGSDGHADEQAGRLTVRVKADCSSADRRPMPSEAVYVAYGHEPS